MDFIWILVAAFLGSIFTSLIYNIGNDGTLKIDRSNPEKDIYRFDINESKFEKLHKKRYVTLKVDPNADLTHQ